MLLPFEKKNQVLINKTFVITRIVEFIPNKNIKLTNRMDITQRKSTHFKV